MSIKKSATPVTIPLAESSVPAGRATGTSAPRRLGVLLAFASAYLLWTLYLIYLASLARP